MALEANRIDNLVSPGLNKSFDFKAEGIVCESKGVGKENL